MDPDHILRFEYGITEPFGGGGGFGTKQGLVPTSSASAEEQAFVDVPPFKLDEGTQAIDTLFPDNVLPYPSSSSSSSSSSSYSSSFMAGSDSFYPNFDFDLFALTSAEVDAEAFRVGSILDHGKDLDLDLEVPDFNFELGVGEDDEMSRGLAAWAGYE